MVVWKAGDSAAGPASGSYQTRGMIIVPATTAVIAGEATGISKDLIQRAADVTLNERGPRSSCQGRPPFAPARCGKWPTWLQRAP
jgi:3-polyprenyl-4-hydroxybenzoate decarboxylase